MSIINDISEKLGKGSYASIIQWLDKQNGVSGIIEKFRQGGLSEIIESWTNSDNPLPISAEQVQKIFSHDNITKLAEKLGLSDNETAQTIADHLPKIVSMLTQSGQNGSDKTTQNQEGAQSTNSQVTGNASAHSASDDEPSLLEKGVSFIKDKILK